MPSPVLRIVLSRAREVSPCAPVCASGVPLRVSVRLRGTLRVHPSPPPQVSADGGPSALQAAWGTAAEGAGRVTTATRRGAAAGRDAQLQDLTTGVTLQRFASFVAVLSGVALLMRRAVRSMRPRGAAVMSPLPPLAMMSASGEPDPRDNSAPEAEAPRDPYPAPSSPAEYVFGRPGEFARDLELLGTSPRRVLLSVGASAALGLGGNFLGVTSSLLSTLPQVLAPPLPPHPPPPPASMKSLSPHDSPTMQQHNAQTRRHKE